MEDVGEKALSNLSVNDKKPEEKSTNETPKVEDEKSQRLNWILKNATKFDSKRKISRDYCTVPSKERKNPDFVGGLVIYKPTTYKEGDYHSVYYKNDETKSNENKKKLCRMLLVTGWREGKWNKPGGSINENEVALDALNREFREETGCKVAIFKDEDYLFSSYTYLRREHHAHVYAKEINDLKFFEELLKTRPEQIFEIYSVVSVPIFKESKTVGLPQYFESAFDTAMESVGREEIIWILYALQVISKEDLKDFTFVERNQRTSY